MNITGFATGFVEVLAGARRITLQSLISTRDQATVGSSGWGSDISVVGTQVLVKDCQSIGVADARSFAVSTASQTAGPNAVVNHKSSLSSQIIQPHEHWAHGLLVDNSQSGVQFINRATGA